MTKTCCCCEKAFDTCRRAVVCDIRTDSNRGLGHGSQSGWNGDDQAVGDVAGRPTGVNFINVFTRSFHMHRSQKRKRNSQVKHLFALLWYAWLKTACKMLMKLTPGNSLVRGSQLAEDAERVCLVSCRQKNCSRFNFFRQLFFKDVYSSAQIKWMCG